MKCTVKVPQLDGPQTVSCEWFAVSRTWIRRHLLPSPVGLFSFGRSSNLDIRSDISVPYSRAGLLDSSWSSCARILHRDPIVTLAAPRVADSAWRVRGIIKESYIIYNISSHYLSQSMILKFILKLHYDFFNFYYSLNAFITDIGDLCISTFAQLFGCRDCWDYLHVRLLNTNRRIKKDL